MRGSTGEVLDQALVLRFPGPDSYTGEDCVELHLHGGRAVLAGVVDAVTALGGRPAEPGEFSRRAFLNERIDLLEAEAIADLVAADTDAQRRQALRQMQGALGTLYRDWAARLLALLARQEALIDFPDEDLPPEVERQDLDKLMGLRTEMSGHLKDGRRGERLRDGLVFAIAGHVNAGKSTLLNALAGREAAIVSHHAGTTRDVLEIQIDLDGVPVTFLDTAGLRESHDDVEAEGVRRAIARVGTADAVLLVGEAGSVPAVLPPTDAVVIDIETKIDLKPAMRPNAVAVSAATGEGFNALRDRLVAVAGSLTQASGPPPLTRTRHRVAIAEALACLEAASAASLPELRAEDLRRAVQTLGRVTGQVGVEDMLDSLFRQFCIGK